MLKKEYTEEQLIEKIKLGDNLAFEIFLEKKKKLIASILRKSTVEENNIEDIMQEIRLAIYNAVLGYDGSTPLDAYLRICSYNKLNTIYNKTNNKTNEIYKYCISLYSQGVDGAILMDTIEDLTPNPETQYIYKEQLREVTIAIDEKLSKYEKEILPYYYQGYSIQSIANKLSKDSKSVDNAIQRMKCKIKKVIEEKKWDI